MLFGTIPPHLEAQEVRFRTVEVYDIAFLIAFTLLNSSNQFGDGFEMPLKILYILILSGWYLLRFIENPQS
ncbi:hypothetical protein [Marivirga aurantiaca]|uniref:hypothetical protein n=1 Tax=Marivirga aurantiaca TaxID=2802615 RepID=UPI0019174ED4|nr:hypothetical protein [Marivirga aurantiaca]